ALHVFQRTMRVTWSVRRLLRQLCGQMRLLCVSNDGAIAVCGCSRAKHSCPAPQIAALRLKWLLTTEGRRAFERRGEKAANHTEQSSQMHAQLFLMHHHSFEAQRRRKTIPSCYLRRRRHHSRRRGVAKRSRVVM